jgi:hypothetical protein
LTSSPEIERRVGRHDAAEPSLPGWDHPEPFSARSALDQWQHLVLEVIQQLALQIVGRPGGSVRRSAPGAAALALRFSARARPASTPKRRLEVSLQLLDLGAFRGLLGLLLGAQCEHLAKPSASFDSDNTNCMFTCNLRVGRERLRRSATAGGVAGRAPGSVGRGG